MPARIKGLDKAIRDMKARTKAFRGGKPYDEVSVIMASSINQNFNAGGRPKWQKRKGQYSHPILDLTGTMRDKAESSTSQWKHGRVLHINNIIGPQYGRVHQYTGVRTKQGNSIKNIVRKYVVFHNAEIEKMKQSFRKAFHQ